MDKTGENRVEKLIGVCFLVIGLVMVTAGLVVAALSLRYKNDAARVEAVIVNPDVDIPAGSDMIDAARGFGSGTCVEYEVGGTRYRTVLSETSSSFHYGDKITLYVDRNDPTRAHSILTFYLLFFIPEGIAIPFLAIGIGFLIALSSKKKKKSMLLANGRKVWAEVTGGRVDYHYQVGTRHPYRLDCRYTDDRTGNVYMCSSNYVWFDPSLYVGQQVAVYVDQSDPKKYYVDAESLNRAGSPAGGYVYDYR